MAHGGAAAVELQERGELSLPGNNIAIRHDLGLHHNSGGHDQAHRLDEPQPLLVGEYDALSCSIQHELTRLGPKIHQTDGIDTMGADGV